MREFLQPSAPSILRLTPLKYGVCTVQPVAILRLLFSRLKKKAFLGGDFCLFQFPMILGFSTTLYGYITYDQIAS